MKKMSVLFIISLFALSACTTETPQIQPTHTTEPSPTSTVVPAATATSKPTPFFELFSPDPIVPNGENGAWDDKYTDPGAVIYKDGVFHMFRNGFRGFPAESQVGYATSPDGYTWTKQGDDPVLETKDISYAKIAMYASSVIWEDGCWILYFYTWDSASYPSSSVIGRATQCMAGPALTDWIVDATPVLSPGINGDWDDKQVLSPDVLKTENGYVMYYSGVGDSGIQMIGMATSTDGVNWVKYNDPNTIAQPFMDSDPVFQPDEKSSWDAGWVHQPRVFQEDNQWVMIYRGTKTTAGEKMAIGLATSTDGIYWERSAMNPIFTPLDIPKAGYLWFHNALLVDDTYYLFIEGDINQSTQIYLATHKGYITK